MIGKIITAAIGNQVAKNTRGIGGPAGAAIGFIAPALLRRISLPAMLAVAAGGLCGQEAGREEQPHLLTIRSRHEFTRMSLRERNDEAIRDGCYAVADCGSSRTAGRKPLHFRHVSSAEFA